MGTFSSQNTLKIEQQKEKVKTIYNSNNPHDHHQVLVARLAGFPGLLIRKCDHVCYALIFLYGAKRNE